MNVNVNVGHPLDQVDRQSSRGTRTWTLSEGPPMRWGGLRGNLGSAKCICISSSGQRLCLTQSLLEDASPESSIFFFSRKANY